MRVGVQYGTDAEQIVLFEIINRCYLDLRPTIILSNLPIEPVSSEKTVQQFLGERAFDRLRENAGRLVVFDWESHRKSM